MQRTGGFYFNIPKHFEHCGHCETYSKQPPTSLFLPALSHPDLDIQATRPTPTPFRFLWQQYLLMICLVDKHTVLKKSQSMICNAASMCGSGEPPPPSIVGQCVGPGWVPSQLKSKALPLALWQYPLPLEPLIITCEGELVIFLIILHFISIPPFKSQHENWLPQRSIFIISLRPINYPTLGQGGRGVQAQADPFHSRAEQSHITAVCWGSRTEWGCSFARWKREGKKVHLLSCEPSNM